MMVSARVVKTCMSLPSCTSWPSAPRMLVREGEAHALALADPVLLHQAHALGPAFQVVRAGAVVDAGQQLVGVLRDGQVVAGDLALLDDGPRCASRGRPTTCSLASTVWSTGSQLTTWVFL